MLLKCLIDGRHISGHSRLRKPKILSDQQKDVPANSRNSSLGALFVLSIASQSPQLRHLVTDLPSLQTILVDRWKLWSMPGPIFEQAIRMIETIQNKEALARQIS